MIVTVDELKAHLRIQTEEEDTLLESLLAQAQATAEDRCRTTFEDANAPEPVRLAITLMASHFYEYRDCSDKAAYATMNAAFSSLLSPYLPPERMF